MSNGLGKIGGMKMLLILLFPLIVISCGHQHPPLPTVKNLDPVRYQGQWHEVARLHNFFERNVVAARATYKLIPGSKKLSVLNEGKKANGIRTSIKGRATPVGSTPDGEARLAVRFNRFPASLFEGKYWILYLNEAHTRAAVGTPDRKFLWLLAKDPADQISDFEQALELLKKQGFATESLIINPKRLK